MLVLSLLFDTELPVGGERVYQGSRTELLCLVLNVLLELLVGNIGPE